jgi:hypothetical protein
MLGVLQGAGSAASLTGRLQWWHFEAYGLDSKACLSEAGTSSLLVVLETAVNVTLVVCQVQIAAVHTLYVPAAGHPGVNKARHGHALCRTCMMQCTHCTPALLSLAA